jgi:hypothetical protein
LSGGALIGILLLVFFLAGIAVGVVAVIAVSARRTRVPPGYGWPRDGDEEDRAGDPGPDPDGFGDGPGGFGDGPGGPPRWPG